MSKREDLVKAVEEAQEEYDCVKHQHSHESSIALDCLSKAEERLDEFDGVSDSQKIKRLESQLAEAREIAEDAINEINPDPLEGRKFTVMELYIRLEKLKEQG